MNWGRAPTMVTIFMRNSGMLCESDRQAKESSFNHLGFQKLRNQEINIDPLIKS